MSLVPFSTAASAPAAASGAVFLLRGSGQGLTCARFSATGLYLATASLDHSVLLWSSESAHPSSYKNVGVLKGGHNQAITEVCWNGGAEDRSLVFVSSADASSSVYDADTLQRVKKLGRKFHAASVNCIAYNTSQQLVFTGSDDCSVQQVDLRAMSQPAQKFSSDYQVLCVASQGNLVVYGGIDNYIQTYDIRKPESVLYVLQGHKDSCTGLALSHSGSHLLSNSQDNTLIVHTLEPYVTAALQQTRIVHSIPHAVQHDPQQHLLRCSWSSDDRWVAAGTSARAAYILDAATGQPTYTVSGHSGVITDVQFHPRHGIIATASMDKSSMIASIPKT